MSDFGWLEFFIWSEYENIKVINEEWESFTKHNVIAPFDAFDNIEESKIQGFKDLLSEKEKGMPRSGGTTDHQESTLLETLETDILQHLRDDDNLLDMSQFEQRINHLLEQGSY